jgi:hypothetical protein
MLFIGKKWKINRKSHPAGARLAYSYSHRWVIFFKFCGLLVVSREATTDTSYQIRECAALF